MQTIDFLQAKKGAAVTGFEAKHPSQPLEIHRRHRTSSCTALRPINSHPRSRLL